MGGPGDLFCYNKGCGKTFKPEENGDDVCQHHPGAPIFHDAYKGWSCCNKKSTDFTEFLNFPGCAKGRHSNEKPEQPVKSVEKPMEIGEVYKEEAPQMKFRPPTQRLERPSDDIPKSKINTIVGSSLKSALQRLKMQADEQKENTPDGSGNADAVQLGAACKNNSCECKFAGADSGESECVYHSGAPVFHEGYKFWSCCQKRTSDFNEFLKQTGCQTGQHRWMRPSEVAEKKSACRYDWHQTGSNVIISIYAKVCDPEKCSVEANDTGLKVYLVFNGGSNVFELDVKLHGIIDPTLSSVEYLGTKAEIKLRKKEPFSWSSLEFKQPVAS